MSAIAQNLAEVRKAVADEARKAARKDDSVRLLAVSKTFPAEDVKEAYDAGQRMFGENRVQELETKAPLLPADIEWHLIGHLQSNKAAKAVEYASWIHSVDSEKLLERIAKAAEQRGKVMNILLEVNISGEESKFGLRDYEEIRSIASSALQMPNIRLQGLMTMAEFDATETRLHETFAGLRAMRDRLEKELDGDATPSSRNELLFLVKEVSRRCGRAKVEDLLSRRDYSSSELAERLRRDGYSDVLVEELVTRALECGLVNDARYGAAFARSKVACGWGRVKIERELERRGVPVSSVEGWPEEFFSEDEEREHARLLASRRRVTGKNDYEKTVRFLVGRGYGYALSSEVARDILRGED